MDGILSEVLSFVGGLIGGFTLKIAIDVKKSKADTRTRQQGNVVGGHQAGRDVNTRG